MNVNERINELKDSIHSLWEKVRKGEDASNLDEDESRFDFERNYEDDMPLRLERESSPGVKYYSTENSPFAVGAEKVEHAGIDSFGEDDSPDPEQLTPER